MLVLTRQQSQENTCLTKKISRNYHQVVPYIKLPVTMELKVRVNFFGTKMRALSGVKSQQNFYIPSSYISKSQTIENKSWCQNGTFSKNQNPSNINQSQTTILCHLRTLRNTNFHQTFCNLSGKKIFTTEISYFHYLPEIINRFLQI